MELDSKTLEQLILGGESQTIEFKVQPPRVTDLAARLCGFANSAAGGLVVIGVVDTTWEIAGVKNTAEAIDALLQAARHCKPPVPLADGHPRVVDIGGKKLVIAEILRNRGELYQAGGAFLIRKGTHTVAMSAEEVEKVLYTTGQLNWETRPNILADLEDLDEHKIDEYLGEYERLTGSRNRLADKWERLTKMQCVVALPEDREENSKSQKANPVADPARRKSTAHLKPTNAGLILFGNSPRDFFTGAEIVATYYQDASGVQRYTDRQILTGVLPAQLEAAETFFRKHIQIGARIEGFKRIEEPEYSLEALREALVNAVVHRDYSLQGEAVRVFFYADRIEIHSPGTLPPGIDLTDLRQGLSRSRPRNQVIASVMRDMPGHYMERIGSGIRFMLNQSEALELPVPQFKEQGGEFVVTFFKRELAEPATRFQSELPDYVRPGPTSGKAATTGAGLKEGVGGSGGKTGLSRPERQELALAYVRENGDISNNRYRDLTGVSENTALRDLEALVNQKSLRAVGQGRTRRYVL